MEGEKDEDIIMNKTEIKKEISEINPVSAIEYAHRANLCLLVGRYQDAIVDYSRAINLDIEIVERFNVYQSRGFCYFELGLYYKAIEDYNAGINLYSLGCYRDRGDAYYELELYKDAITDYKIALQNYPHGYEVFTSLGNSWLKLSNYDEALECYNNAIIFGERDLSGYVDRGELEDSPHFINCKKSLSTAYCKRGEFYSNVLQDYEKASVDFGESIKVDENGTAYYNRAMIQFSLNDYGMARNYRLAIDDLGHAIRINPNDADAYYLRYRAYRMIGSGNYKQSDSDLRKSIRLNPFING